VPIWLAAGQVLLLAWLAEHNTETEAALELKPFCSSSSTELGRPTGSPEIEIEALDFAEALLGVSVTAADPLPAAEATPQEASVITMVILSSRRTRRQVSSPQDGRPPVFQA
jgi:hypothetical protein